MVVMSSTGPQHIHKRGGELGAKLSGRGDCNMYTTTNGGGNVLMGMWWKGQYYACSIYHTNWDYLQLAPKG